MRNILITELNHFKKLSEQAQQLLVSYTIYELMYPILITFVNAFIIRRTNDFNIVSIYNLGVFVGLPIAFYLNGWLLRKMNILVPFSIGMVGQALVSLSVFSLNLTQMPHYFLFGLLQGLPLGLYWANRNFLNLDTTQDDNRNYFSGLEMTLATITTVITPILVGWFLGFIDLRGGLSLEMGYQLLGILALGLLVYASIAIRKKSFTTPTMSTIFIPKMTTAWWWVRAIELIRGVENGIYLFIMPLLIFALVGQESALGILQSLASLIAALLLYFAARFTHSKHRLKVTLFCNIFLVILSLVLAITFNSNSAILYILLTSFIAHLLWTVLNPVMMKVIDEQEDGDATNNYAYIADQEFWLNCGRALGVVLFLGISSHAGQLTSLRFLPLISALIQIGVIYFVYLICRHKSFIMKNGQ